MVVLKNNRLLCWISRRETIIVFGMITGLLLPIRLVFYSFVSTNWFGSFGLVTAVSIIVLILMNKGKLGKFGEMIQRQMEKSQKGKRSIIIYCEQIFIITIMISYIACVNMSGSFDGKDVDIVMQTSNEIAKGIGNTLDWNDISSQNIVAYQYDLISKIVKNPFVFLYGISEVCCSMHPLPLEFISAELIAGNIISHGGVLHLSTVILAENLETFSLLLIFRYIGVFKIGVKNNEDLIIPKFVCKGLVN